MKAKQVLARYAAGQRNFAGANLRGQSFQGQDLSGSDFSGADIRGANFTGGNLKGCNFTAANSGLQRRWVLGLMIASLACMILSGIVTGIAGIFVFIVFTDSELFNPIMGIILLVFYSIFIFVTIRKGIEASLRFSIFSLTISFAMAVVSTIFKFGGAVAVAFVVDGIVGGALSGAAAGAVTFIGAIGLAIAVAVAGYAAGAFTVSIAVIFAIVIAAYANVSFAVALGVTILSASSILMLSVYIAWYALKENQKYILVLNLAVACVALRGASFRYANLMGSNFTQAQLKSIDLRDSQIFRTCWNQVKKLDRARLGGTMLMDPDVRALLITRQGQGKDYSGRNFKGAYLADVNLTDADLTGADLSGATLAGACLVRTNLTRVQALALSFPSELTAFRKRSDTDEKENKKPKVFWTDFYQANLTGACLEAWNIDSTTQLEGAIADYVYLRNNQGERRPSSGEFAPGEFTKLFQKVLENC